MTQRSYMALLVTVVTLSLVGCTSKKAPGLDVGGFRLSVTDGVTSDSQTSTRIKVEAGSPGRVFSAGFGTPADGLITNIGIDDNTALNVLASIETDSKGQRFVAVGLESVSNSGKSGLSVKYPIPDGLALESAFKFTLPVRADYKVRETVTLAEVHGGKALTLTVTEK